MGLSAEVKRIIRSVTPVSTRANNGVYTQIAPRTGAITADTAGTQLAGHATAAGKYGARVQVLAATAFPTTALWAEGVYVANWTDDKQIMYVAVSTGTGAVTAAGQLLGEVCFWPGTGTGTTQTGQYLPFSQPVYLPPGTVISLALAPSVAAKKVQAWLVHSANK